MSYRIGQPLEYGQSPLRIMDGDTIQAWKRDGSEVVTLDGIKKLTVGEIIAEVKRLRPHWSWR